MMGVAGRKRYYLVGIIAGASMFGMASSAQAVPIGYNFSQGGFAEGATVDGMFFGEDLDNNDQLSSFAGEITDAMMSFSGNSIVDAFSLGFSDFVGLVYDLNEGPFIGDGSEEGIEFGTDAETFDYHLGPIFFFPTPCDTIIICGEVLQNNLPLSFGVDTSTALASVTVKAIPEPSTLALFATGLALLAFLGWRRRKAA